jgi:tellurite resistance protein
VSKLPATHPQALQRSASISNLPVNLFASVMGIAGVAIAWRHAVQWMPIAARVADLVGGLSIAVFLALSLGYVFKAVRHPAAVVDEFRHPIAGNFFGTIPIAILLLSSLVAQQAPALAEKIWMTGTVLTIALCFVIKSRLFHGQVDADKAVPAWFIPGVATLDIVVAGGSMPMPWAHEINLFALAVGTMIALLLFTVIMSRIIHHERLPKGMLPSLLILIAPFEVGFLAYTNFTQQVDTFSGLLFYFGLFMFIILVPKVFGKGIPFGSGWWAISFPMAALTSAALKYADHVQLLPLTVMAIALLCALSIVVAVLFVKTLLAIFDGSLLAA